MPTAVPHDREPLTRLRDLNRPKIKTRCVATQLCVVGRVAVTEYERKAQLLLEKFARCVGIRDDELLPGADNCRFAWGRFHSARGNGDSSFQCLPTSEAVLSCDHFLRIAELEAGRKNLRIGHVPETRNKRADLCGDGIVPFTMPTQYELGLLFEVLEIGHAGLHDGIVGGHCPSAKRRCTLHAPTEVSAALSETVN